jgi:hypothetical protein
MHLPRPARVLGVTVVIALSAVSAGCGDDDDAEPAATSSAVADTSADSPASTAASTASTARSSTVTTATPTSSPTDTAPAAEGVTYTSPEGDYSAVFADEPTEQQQSQPLPDGTTIEYVIVGLETPDRFFATSRGEYPEGTVLDVPVALDGAQDQAIANVEGTLIDSRDIELQGRPGREFSASVSSGGTPGTVLQRVYLDGPVIYQALVVGTGELTFDDPEAAAFLDSFSFTS